MLLLGLTGGIASGKSTVARMIQAIGVPVVDADLLARDAVAPGTPGLAAVVARFGQQMLLQDGNLDRKKLGALVFGDDVARADLNAIVHPQVALLAQQRLAELAAAGASVVVYEAALLFEAKLEGMMAGTILVATSEPVQLARLMARDGIDEAAARARLAAQMSLEEKRKRATVVVDNGGALLETARQLGAAWHALTGETREFQPA